MRRLLVTVSVLALVLLVATAGVALATHSPAAKKEVVGKDSTGAQYALFLPNSWNGNLVVYAHGFIDPEADVALPDAAPIDVAPWVMELRERLLQAGYGVAYSSYSENGWAVDDGAKRTLELRPLFEHYFDEPDRTYVIGRSLGALTTMLMVEKYSTVSTPGISLLGLISLGGSTERVVDGALALCGPVGGGRKQTDYVANARVLFDFFYPGVMPGHVLDVPRLMDYSSDSPQVQAIVGSILQNPQAAMALASVDQIELPWTNFPELINTIVRVLGYNVLGTNDLLDRTGDKSPFENRSTTYTGLGVSDAGLNASVGRFEGKSDAIKYLTNFYQPTGKLQTNVLTLHTTLDPDVPFSHEQTLATIVGKAGSSYTKKLVQQHYARYGHCNFTPAETASALFRLAAWVKNGVKPVAGLLAP